MIKCFRLRLSGCAVRLAPDNGPYRILEKEDSMLSAQTSKVVE
tara:strand:+ start:1970 stop:2098 length:129 start_codon:yes stop_codon:yes gene_type:complete